MLSTINGIDLVIAISGLLVAWGAYERGRDTGYREGFDRHAAIWQDDRTREAWNENVRLAPGTGAVTDPRQQNRSTP